tara:strand:+ start:49 stop:300 length:252 start_codon:yes stop_codon:yes gene_type:complete
MIVNNLETSDTNIRSAKPFKIANGISITKDLRLLLGSTFSSRLISLNVCELLAILRNYSFKSSNSHKADQFVGCKLWAIYDAI